MTKRHVADISKDVYLLWRVLRQICGEHEGKYCSSCPLIGIECMIEFCENKEDLDELIAAVQKWLDEHPTFEDDVMVIGIGKQVEGAEE